jgi:hypothetical protein
MKARARRARGAAAPETAAVLAVTFALLSGAVDLGWYFGQRTLLEDAVRTAVRVGATTPFGVDPVSTAHASLKTELAASEFDAPVKAYAFVVGYKPQQRLRVEARATAQPLLGLLPTPTQYKVITSMRLERQR